MTDKNQLIPINEFIAKAKERNIDLGHGDPTHRIRYYIKNGLLPHQVRLSNPSIKAGTTTYTVGHLPLYALDLLQTIAFLKSKGMPFEEIKSTITKERLSLEAEEITYKIPKSIPFQDFLSKLVTFATIVFLFISLNVLSKDVKTPIPLPNISALTQQSKSNEANLHNSVSTDSLFDKKTILLEVGKDKTGNNIFLVNNLPLDNQAQQVTVDNEGNISSKSENGQQVLSAKVTDVLINNVGTAVLKANTTTLQVLSAQVNQQSKIFLTARSKTQGQPLIVTTIKDGSFFTVEIEKPITSDVLFDWLIVN